MDPVLNTRRGRLYCGDLHEVLPALGARWANLIWFDGPYGMGKAEWDRFPNLTALVDWYRRPLALMTEAASLSASVYLWGTDETEAALRDPMRALGWTYRGRVTWDKGTSKAVIGAEGMRTWLDVTECAGFYQRVGLIEDLHLCAADLRDADAGRVLGVDSRLPALWRGWPHVHGSCWPTREQWRAYAVAAGQRPDLADWAWMARRPPAFNCSVGGSNVWRHPQVGGASRLRIPSGESHPCQKPLAFAKRAILASSRPGETVLDLCAGTHRIAVACERLPEAEARRHVSVEYDPRWVELVRPLLTTAPETTATATQPSLFGGP